MALVSRNQRFFTSTRGQILLLLRRSARTVDELAQKLHLTDNAVRAHLATLERDGLVRQRGERRGASKPAALYELAQEGESLFPKAYGQVLHELFDVLHEQIEPAELDALLRLVGQRLASRWSLPDGELRPRLELAVDALNSLGGLAELEEEQECYAIRGYSCPFAEAVTDHQEVCHLAASLLTVLIGEPTLAQCVCEYTPHCCFIVSKPPMHSGV